jgi:hypothetical protein
MAVELAEMQQQMAGKSTGRAGPPQQQEEQTAAKAVGRLDNEAVVEAAVSAITTALQQHFIFAGGQPKSSPRTPWYSPPPLSRRSKGQQHLHR